MCINGGKNIEKKSILSIIICILIIFLSYSSVKGTIYNEKKENYYNNLIAPTIVNIKLSDNDWYEYNKILASDGATQDWFGFSVSIDGNYAIVGASFDDDSGSNSGSAYIFKRDGTTWIQQTKLLASDGVENDFFGCSVSIDGDYAIVGAYCDDDNGDLSGSAYIFKSEDTTWIQQAKLIASDGASGDAFGNYVSIDGDYAIVGAYCDDDNGIWSGSAYVFKREDTTWIQQAKLLASDGLANDFFGCSVSINDDYAIVGAYYDGDNGLLSGSSYIFKRNGIDWNVEAKLLASDGSDFDFFGCSVDISGDYAIIGAYGDDDNGNESGSAYVFKKDGTTWNEEAKLLALDGEEYDYFSYTVSIDGDNTIIGAYGDDDEGIDSGSAYIFKRVDTNWNEEDKLLASDGASSDEFGCSVSIDDKYAIIGARDDSDNGYESGSAYIFKKTSPDLDCSGSLTWEDIEPRATVTGTINVENIGESESLLDWKIESYPDWGTWSFDPESGIDLFAGDKIDINVEVIAPDETETTFTGEVIIANCEDLDDTCTIDISLATPQGQVKQLPQIIMRFFENNPNLFPLLQRLVGL